MALLKKTNGSLVPFGSMLSFFLEITDFFKDSFWNKDWIPAVNISKNDTNYEIEVAVPGMKKEDFKVTVNKGVIIISAEKKEEKREKKRNYTRQEYNWPVSPDSFR